MANQIYVDSNKEPKEKHQEEDETLGFVDLGKIIIAIYSLTAPYFIVFILLFALATVLILGVFLR